MPLLRDISPYSQDIGWLIGLIQDNDDDGWLRTYDAIGGFYAEEGREGDDLIPQDHEVAFSYLNQLPLQDRNLIQSKMIEFEEPSLGDVLTEGAWESIRYLPKAVGGMTAQWAEGAWRAKLDRRNEADRRQAQREATREGWGQEFADAYKEPELPENYQRFKNFSDGMITELNEEKQRAMDNDPHLRGYMRWVQDTPISINPFEEGFFGNPKILARAIGQMIPSAAAMLTGVGTAVATKSPFAGTAVASTLMGFLEGTDEFQQAVAYNLEQGLDMDEATEIATNASIKYAAGSTFLESLPMGRFLRLMNPARKETLRSGLWKRIHNLTSDKYKQWRLNNPKSAYRVDMLGTQSMYEGIQELAQYSTQVAIQTGYKDETFREIYDIHEAGESFYGGVVMGGVFGGGAYLANQYLGNLPSDTELAIQEETAQDETDVYRGPVEAEATLPNYLKSILAPIIGKRRVTITDPQQGSSVEKLLKNHATIGGEVGQKISDILREGGVEVYDALTTKEQVFVDTILKGMLGRRSPKLAEVIENPVEAIATGQIRVDRIVPKSGIQAGAQRRGSMVKVEDSQLIEEWLKSFPATQIQEELGRHKKGLTQTALSKWAEDQGVDIRGHLEKELVSSIKEQGRIDRLVPSSSMEEVLLSDMENELQRQMETEAMDSAFGASIAVDPLTNKVTQLADEAASQSDFKGPDIGSRGLVVEGPYKGETIEIVEQPEEYFDAPEGSTYVRRLKNNDIISIANNRLAFQLPVLTDPEVVGEPPRMTDSEIDELAAEDLSGRTIDVYNVKGEKYKAKVTAVSEQGSVKVINQEGKEVILGSDLSAVTENVNSPDYQIQSSALSDAVQGEVVGEMTDEQLADVAKELKKRLDSKEAAGQGAERFALMDLNAVTLASRRDKVPEAISEEMKQEGLGTVLETDVKYLENPEITPDYMVEGLGPEELLVDKKFPDISLVTVKDQETFRNSLLERLEVAREDLADAEASSAIIIGEQEVPPRLSEVFDILLDVPARDGNISLYWENEGLELSPDDAHFFLDVFKQVYDKDSVSVSPSYKLEERYAEFHKIFGPLGIGAGGVERRAGGITGGVTPMDVIAAAKLYSEAKEKAERGETVPSEYVEPLQDYINSLKRDLARIDQNLITIGEKTAEPVQEDLFANQGEQVDDVVTKKERRAEMSQAVREGIKEGLKGISSLEPDPFSASMNFPRLTSKSKKVASEHFEKMWSQFDTAWQIAFDDYVKAVFRAIEELPAKARDAMKSWFNEWQNQKAEDLDVKVSATQLSGIGTWMDNVLGRTRSKAYQEISESHSLETIYNAIASELNEELSQEATTEGLEIIDFEDVHDGKYSNTKMGDEHYNFINSTYVRFLGDYITNQDTAELLQAASGMDNYSAFTDYIASKFGFVAEDQNQENHQRRFWVMNQPQNRGLRASAPSFNWSNVDPDGKVHSPRVKTNRWLTYKEGTDLKTGRNLSAYIPLSFADVDSLADGRKVFRMYQNDIVKVFKSGKSQDGKSKNFGKDDWVDWTPSFIREMNKKFANFQYVRMDEQGNRIATKHPVTIVGIKGGNRPVILMTSVTEQEKIQGQDEALWKGYWDRQLDADFITKEQHDQIIQDSEGLFEKGHNYSISTKIAIHEFMKSKRYNEYMKNGDIIHHFRRMGLDFTTGAVAVGMGNSTIKVMDKDKVDLYVGNPEYGGKKIPMVDYVAGLDKKYLFDGAIFTDEEYLHRTMDAIGRVESKGTTGGTPLFELKTVIRYRSNDSKLDFGEPLADGTPAISQYYPSDSALAKGDVTPIEGQETLPFDFDNWDGVHYVNGKGNEFVPEPDLYFVEKGNPQNIIAYTKRDGKFIKIFDAQGSRINQLMTNEEAKEPDGGAGSFKLNGRVSTDVLTLPEDARRIVQITAPHSKPSSSSSIASGWADLMNEPDFAEAKTALTDHLRTTSEAYLNMLYQMRDDAKTFQQYVRVILGSNTSIPKEIDKLLRPDGKNVITNGFLHPHIIKTLAPQILNRMIKDGVYKGRRYGASTYVALKPDVKGEVQSPNDVVLSVDNNTTFQYLKKKSGRNTVSEINNWLQDNDTYILSSRFPIPDVQAVRMYRVQSIKQGEHGDVAWFHPETIFGRKQGDFDGDHVTLEFLYKGENYSDSSLVDKILEMQETNAYKNNRQVARLEYFKHMKFDDYTRVQNVMRLMSGFMSRQNMQGMITNTKTIRSMLASKDFKADIGGEIEIVKENDIVMMGYAPLNDNVTQESLDQISGKDANGVVVDKDNKRWTKNSKGDKFLRTTSAHEFSILLQAGVDHGKEMLLVNWRIKDNQDLIRRMFKRTDGKPLNARQTQSLAYLVQFFKYSPDRRGEGPQRFSLDMPQVFERSREIAEHITGSAEEQGTDVIEYVEQRRQKTASYARTEEQMAKVLNKSLPVSSITLNGTSSPIETILSQPHLSMARYNENNVDKQISGDPFHFSPNQTVRAHVAALQNLPVEVTRPYGTDASLLSEADQQAFVEAQDFAETFAVEFGNLFARAKMINKEQKNVFTTQTFDYDQQLNDLIEKWLYVGEPKFNVKPFEALSEKQKAAATILFLEGTAREKRTQNVAAKKQLANASASIDKRTEKITNLVKEIAVLEKGLPVQAAEGEYSVESKDSKAAEAIQKKIDAKNKAIKALEDNNIRSQQKIEALGTLGTFYRSRTRDVQKLPPIELMHKPTYTQFIQEFGRQLPKASKKPIKLSKIVRLYENQPRVIQEKLDKENNCGV